MLHTEESKLASVLAMIFGALLAMLGALMIFELGFSANAYGSAGLVWGGIAILLAGKAIRRTRVLLIRPRWFFAASLFGISSSAGLYKTILTGDTAGTIGLIPLQSFALYALWRACRQ
jgi:hypothetical protein